MAKCRSCDAEIIWAKSTGGLDRRSADLALRGGGAMTVGVRRRMSDELAMQLPCARCGDPPADHFLNDYVPVGQPGFYDCTGCFLSGSPQKEEGREHMYEPPALPSWVEHIVVPAFEYPVSGGMLGLASGHSKRGQR